MRRIVTPCLLAIVLTLAAGCGKKDSTTTDGGPPSGAPHTPGIEGMYLLTGMEADGKALPEELFKGKSDADRTIKITADQLIATDNGKEDPANYKVNTSKTPHEIDMTGKKMGKEEKMYGIYKLDGDILTICFAESGNPTDRPKEFKTTEGSKTGIMILKKK